MIPRGCTRHHQRLGSMMSVQGTQAASQERLPLWGPRAARWEGGGDPDTLLAAGDLKPATSLRDPQLGLGVSGVSGVDLPLPASLKMGSGS